MSVKISKKKRTYYSGITTSTEIRQLVVDKLISYGASCSTGRVPYGVLSKVAKDLFLSSMTVKRVWNYYIVNSTVEPFRAKPGPNQKLTDEDVDYVCQLVIFKPSLYKKEIRELILENSNSNYDSLSVSTVQKTVRERISSIKFTHKRTQRSNKWRWTETNIIYTRNFMTFIATVSPFSLRYVDEANVNEASSHRLYGSSESGSRAIDISDHKQGNSYTLFTLIGLNDKCYNEVELAPTDGNAFINFMYNACNATNDRGERIIEPGTVIVTDCASVHSGVVQTILKPYLQDLQVHHVYLPKFSPDMNCCEWYIGALNRGYVSAIFKLCAYHIPTAVLAAASTIGPDMVYSFFKDMSCNYLNL